MAAVLIPCSHIFSYKVEGILIRSRSFLVEFSWVLDWVRVYRFDLVDLGVMIMGQEQKTEIERNYTLNHT